jgi:hypothetical protein
MTEYFETGTKKGRGMAQRSRDLIEAMHAICKAAQPITGRGVGYKLFTRSLIPSMARPEMARVYRLLKEARERGFIEWEWVVDEGRDIVWGFGGSNEECDYEPADYQPFAYLDNEEDAA